MKCRRIGWGLWIAITPTSRSAGSRVIHRHGHLYNRWRLREASASLACRGTLHQTQPQIKRRSSAPSGGPVGLQVCLQKGSVCLALPTRHSGIIVPTADSGRWEDDGGNGTAEFGCLSLIDGLSPGPKPLVLQHLCQEHARSTGYRHGVQAVSIGTSSEWARVHATAHPSGDAQSPSRSRRSFGGSPSPGTPSPPCRQGKVGAWAKSEEQRRSGTKYCNLFGAEIRKTKFLARTQF